MVEFWHHTGGEGRDDIGAPEHANLRRGMVFCITAFFGSWLAVWAAFDLASASGWAAARDLAMIAAGMLPHLWLARRAWRWLVLHRRIRDHRCVACGYPIAGTTVGPCPECGGWPFAPLRPDR